MTSIDIVTTDARKAIAVREKVRTGDSPQAVGRMFGELMPLIGKEVVCTGPPFALYHSWSKEETDMELGFPISGEGISSGRVHTIELPAVRAATTLHVGPYDRLMETYDRMNAWMGESGHRPADYLWEEYLNSPDDTPPEKLMTRIYWPIR